MNTTRITVRNYFKGHSILHPRSDTDAPVEWHVDSYCVGGEDGVLAVFEHPDLPEGCIGFAQGDDGHWWFSGCIHRHWMPEYLNAIAAILYKAPS